MTACRNLAGWDSCLPVVIYLLPEYMPPRIRNNTTVGATLYPPLCSRHSGEDGYVLYPARPQITNQGLWPHHTGHNASLTVRALGALVPRPLPRRPWTSDSQPHWSVR